MVSGRSATDGRLDRVDTGDRIVILGAVLTVAAAFLPWLSASFGPAAVSITGIDLGGLRTGWTTLALGVVGGGAVIALDEAGSLVALLAGAIVVGISGLYVVDPGGAVGASGVGRELTNAVASPGIGVYATVLGGLLCIAGAILSAAGD